MTDYQRDLFRIQDDITNILAAQANAPTGLTPEAGNTSRLYYRRFQHLSLIGDLPPLATFDAELTTAIVASTQPADLWLLKAHIALRRHRLHEAEAALQADTSFATNPHARLLRSDIEFQHGNYATARSIIEAVIAEDPTWDALARLAYLTGAMGDTSAADALYEQAEDEVTAKQMQTYAWLELQRGTLHFQRGDHTTARRHYNRANASYTGYWLTAERLAELDGAQGHFPEAVAAYTRLHDQAPRPEYKHALADLHALSGDMPSANHWQRLAHTQYLESIAAGEVYHLHYLVDLCCELAGHAEEAIAFARKDLALRNNYMTQGDLAWALYRNNNLTDATTLIDAALASNAVSSRLYFQAACIYAATGNTTRSAHFTHLLKQTNPLPAAHASPLRASESSRGHRPNSPEPHTRYPSCMDLEVTVEQAKALLAEPTPPLLLDCREQWEFDTAHIEGAKLIPMGEIPGRAHQELDDEAPILVLCHHGARSLSVAAWLRQQGFDKAQSVAGGIDAWSRQIDPHIPRY